MSAQWYAGPTQGNGWGVWTVNGSYNVLDHTAPGIDAKANARLIAAAPDMLAALEGLMDHAGQHPHSPTFDAARAAIALAVAPSDRQEPATGQESAS